MALGGIYVPKGLAYETAKAVLQVEPMACNVAKGCKNGCLYCYGPLAFYHPKWREMSFPKKHPLEIIMAQIEKGTRPDGVFMSFATDPLLTVNKMATTHVARYCLDTLNTRVAVLSKEGVLDLSGVRHGITLVSIDERFRMSYEKRAAHLVQRIDPLKKKADEGEYTWVSMEPYPVPAIHEQDITDVLEAVKFVKFIIFGKWNYSKDARTPEARDHYREVVPVFRDFCKSNGIRYHIKSDTLKFINGEK